jgi:hypothetical protein
MLAPVLVKEEQPALKELTELPSSYGHTRLTLMPVDPYHIHAYWEVTPHDYGAVMEHLGSERASAHWALRFYDVTYIDFDGTNAHSYFDQPVDLAASNWYVNLWSSEKTYCADIGARAPTGLFEPACRSNFVRTPRVGESPHYRPEWLRVEGVFDKVECATLSPPSTSSVTAADFPAPVQTAPHEPVAETHIPKYYGELLPLARAVPQDAPGEPRLGSAWHEVRGGLSPTLGSFGGSSWAPASQAAVDLKSNAEVNISGHAQPNQAVQVDGQSLEVNSNRTFSGRPVIPVRK